MSNHSSWVPDQSNWYNQWQTSLTWKIRIQSLIEKAETEIHKIHAKYISHIKGLNNEISITKSTILSKDGTIRKQNDDPADDPTFDVLPRFDKTVSYSQDIDISKSANIIDIKVMASAAEVNRVKQVKNVPVSLKQRKRRTVANPQDMDRIQEE